MHLFYQVKHRDMTPRRADQRRLVLIPPLRHNVNVGAMRRDRRGQVRDGVCHAKGDDIDRRRWRWRDIVWVRRGWTVRCEEELCDGWWTEGLYRSTDAPAFLLLCWNMQVNFDVERHSAT